MLTVLENDAAKEGKYARPQNTYSNYPKILLRYTRCTARLGCHCIYSTCTVPPTVEALRSVTAPLWLPSMPPSTYEEHFPPAAEWEVSPSHNFFMQPFLEGHESFPRDIERQGFLFCSGASVSLPAGTRSMSSNPTRSGVEILNSTIPSQTGG